MTKDFKIKLIAPPYFNLVMYINFSFPYGLGVLTAFLRDNNYNVVLDDLAIKIENNNRKLWHSPTLRINLNILRLLQYKKAIIDYICGHSRNRIVEQFADRVTQIASCEGYDLIGISIMSYFHFLFALLLTRKIKSMHNTKVVLGGPFITLHGKDLFDQFPIVDYMVVGDGQIPLLRLIEYLQGRISIEDVSNLLYRQDGTIKANPREFFPIEDVCIPDFSDLPLDFYRSKIGNMGLILPYQITRGCTHNCSFCSHRVAIPFFEFKSYNKVVKELKIMKRRYQSSSFCFHDDNINCSYEYLDKLCDTFIEEKLDISWKSMAKADNLDKKILYKMKKAGCKFLNFGIESGSNRILKNMGKAFTVEQASKVLENSYQEGIKNILFLIVGFPHEKEEDINKTIEFIRKNSEYIGFIAQVNPLRIGYNTPLYNNPEKFGIENLRPVFDASSIVETIYFAFDEINGLKWEEKIKQQEYFRRRLLKANFKYILSKKYCIGFIPFCFYFYLIERLQLIHRDWFFKLTRFIIRTLPTRKKL